MVPTFAESYLGDTNLSSKKFDQLIIIGGAKLDLVIAKSISITGPLGASNITADAMNITGPASLKTAKLKEVVITGPVSLTDVTSDTVTITGYADFTNVTVAKDLQITGMLKANHSIFNTITLNMSESKIRDSSAKSIAVKRPNSDEPHQKLRLYGNTYIDTIVFESGYGEVHLYGRNIKVGNVKGAEVIQH
ncbi:MAG: hypothetical protein Q8Q56_02150 [Alphaproteobacteria bacterium]|nr:hypothetical protein [Alphaproteobacteria bacterium]